jgi:DNA adenine methylase
MPKQFETYWEPFVGGGALFWELVNTDKIKDAVLSDINLELIMTYREIKTDPSRLLEKLKQHSKLHSYDYYYNTRMQYNLENPVEISARFLYLNKTCYNGLYRVNSKGEFNVPMGKYINPDIVQEHILCSCHKALQRASIECRDFSTIKPKRGDFIYLDPPYYPVNSVSFTRYTDIDFTERDHVKLADFACQLRDRDIFVMISNSDTAFIRNLYIQRGFCIHAISEQRMINFGYEGTAQSETVILTSY